MNCGRKALLAAVGAVALLACAPSRHAVAEAAPAETPTAVERGRALFALAAGCGCHTPAGGPVGAGGKAIETPFGTFYATNITPDPETGIGDWTDEEIDAAIRGGHLPGRGAEAPVMPYYLYAGMSDADARDLIAYLRTLEPVVQANKPHENELPLARWAYRAWQWMFFRPERAPAEAPAGGSERGRYLAVHIALCTDCHTPRNAFGALDWSQVHAGTDQGPGGEKVPDIRPAALEDWDTYDMVNLLQQRMLPDFDNVQGSMAEVVDGVGGGPGYKDAPESELRAIAAYLLEIDTNADRE
jgi:mono/diheme cytochrome c family protein